MSNVLIIKHGSLGDLIQANGAIQDIKNTFKESKVLLLTSKAYALFMSECPYLDGILIDKRLPRWNLVYLLHLKRLFKRYNFTHVFDLQNSSRSNFYQKYLLTKANWSCTATSLEAGQTKKDFDQEPVLKRMEVQLNKSGVKTKYTHQVDLKWSLVDISRMLKQYTSNEYILIFPFCSKKHKNKKWPYFKKLVNMIKEIYKNKYSILVAPGPGEENDANNFNAKVILSGSKPVNLNQLITLIYNSKFVISNDTGPAHICSHLKKEGLVLFGNHTSPKKVSIETSGFKALQVEELKLLSPEIVMNEIRKYLD